MKKLIFNSNEWQKDFLTHYWQKKPLLIRQAFAAETFTLSPEELAGLAGEDDAQSRLITMEPEGTPTLRDGPFAEADFQQLPDSHWTLLVQEVDHFVDEVAQFKEFFSFLPRWRLEDVMISYAADKGGVGAHVDQYDVFLVQGQGERRWRYDSAAMIKPEIVENAPMALLKSFEPDHDVVLKTGDVLYIPPGVPHDGVAIGESMTWSVGLRAPSFQEVCHNLLTAVDAVDSLRWEDKGRHWQPGPTSEVTAGDHLRTVELFERAVALLSQDAGLLGRMFTSHRDGEWVIPSEASELVDGTRWRVHGRARWAWQKADDGALFFVNGKEFSVGSVTFAAGLDRDLLRGDFQVRDSQSWNESGDRKKLWTWMVESGAIEPVV